MTLIQLSDLFVACAFTFVWLALVCVSVKLWIAMPDSFDIWSRIFVATFGTMLLSALALLMVGLVWALLLVNVK